MLITDCSLKQRRRHRRGSALLMVIWLVAMLSLIIYSTIRIVAHDMDLTIAQKQAFRARQLAEMGINVAMNPVVKEYDAALLNMTMCENMEGKMKPLNKKVETKEAARTYAFGSKDKSRGLRKGVTPNRNLAFESLEAEVSSLREKNEEYRKALNIFREKLNEVAIFNSNLAYATRLFTEHSTTKKEKINILRRFDTVESLRESKGLYKTIKEELNKTETKSLTESVNTKLNKTVQTGSSTTLIESKTYEAPQFLRIKDLMSKIS
jgi:hypothetical protein